MKGIFDELKGVGFNNVEQVEVFTPIEHETKGKKEAVKAKVSVSDILYDKSYTCPVCDYHFKVKALRSGKNRLMSVDLDLRPIYDIVNPLYYEPIVCEMCGYGGLTKSFNLVSSMQAKWIKEQITSKYKPYHYPEIVTAEIAIHKYKIVLLNSIIKKAKDGERAYICLKIAWVYRELQKEEEEKVFLQYALTGFLNAYSKERFPIFELDELTVAYIIADIYRRFKVYDKAMQWIGYVALDRSVPLRLKTKALHLKSVIKEERDAAKS